MSKLSENMQTPKTDKGPMIDYDAAQEDRLKKHIRHKGPIDSMLGVLSEVRQAQKALTIIAQRMGRINKTLSKYEAEYEVQE